MIPANSEVDYSGVIYGYYVKYDKLAQLINANFKNSNVTKLTMFVDVYDILLHLKHYIINRDQNTITSRYFIASQIINICAHYREFFRRYYHVDTEFYLVYSDITSAESNELFYKNFKKELLRDNESFYSLVNDNINMLKIICKYIPNVFYIESYNIEFATTVTDIMISNSVNTISIILTKDYYSYQLVRPSIYILRPKKNRSEDNSILIGTSNVAYEYLNEITTSKIRIPIAYSQLSILMSLYKVPNRNIKQLVSISRLSKLYSNPEILSYNSGRRVADIEFMANEFNKYLGQPPIDPYELMYRFKAIDSIISYQSITSNRAVLISYEGYVNLYDVKFVHQMQETYFKYTPLDLEVL